MACTFPFLLACTSAGARLTVMWRGGSANPSAANAPLTRSRDSATALSGSPTT